MSKLNNKKITDKEAFLIYKDSLDILDKLSDEQAGKLFKAIRCFQNEIPLPELDFVLDLLFTNFKNQFIRDNKAYHKKIEDKSYNGRLGNLKRWNTELYQQVEQGIITLEHAEQMHTSLSDKNIAKRPTTSLSDKNIADSDIDNVIEPLPVIDNQSVIDNKLEFKLDRTHSFFSGFDDKTINAVLEWIKYQQEYFNLRIDNGYLKNFKMILQTNIDAGMDIVYSINFIMGSRNADGSRTKTLRYLVNPAIEAKNKNMSVEDRKKQKEDQLKKEERKNILANYCCNASYKDAMNELNRDKRDRLRHFPYKPSEVITKAECDQYKINYPTKQQWDIFNNEKEKFLLKVGGFTEVDCK